MSGREMSGWVSYPAASLRRYGDRAPGCKTPTDGNHDRIAVAN